MAELTDKIVIHFEPKGDKSLVTAIKSLDRATKSMMNTQASMADFQKSGFTATEKGKAAYIRLKNTMKSYDKTLLDVTKDTQLLAAAQRGDTVALMKLSRATRKYTRDLDRNKKSILGTTHDTRILGGAFSVLRSKLLLVSFAVALVSATFGKLISGYGKQEKAEKRLKQALKSTGHSAGVTHKQLLLMASGLQAVTTHGDEAVIEAQSLMLTFTNINKDVFPQALESILNVSDAMGQDLKQSTIQIGKALNDPIQGMSALRRIGIQLSDTQKNQVKDFVAVNDVASAQKIIIKELDTQFGGMARAVRLTLSGSLIALSNSWGDMMEKMGEKMAPFISGLATALESITSIMKSEGEKQLDFLRQVGASEETIKLATIRLLKEEAQERLKSIQVTGIDLNKTNELSQAYQEQQIVLVAMQDNLARKEKALSASTTTLMSATKSSLEFNKALVDGDNAMNTSATTTSYWGGVTKERVLSEQTAMGQTIAINKESVEGQKEQIPNQIEFNLALRDYLVSLGLIPNIAGNADTAVQSLIQYTTIAKSALQAFGEALVPGASAGDSLRKFFANYLTLIQGVILASGAMSGALSMAWVPGLGTGAAIAALVALEAAKAVVMNVKFAEKGFDGVVNSPTMFMTGEGNKAEHVSITPLQGPNVNGPQGGGGGVNITIQGGIVDESYVRNELIPAINQATSMGSRINA